MHTNQFRCIEPRSSNWEYRNSAPPISVKNKVARHSVGPLASSSKHRLPARSILSPSVLTSHPGVAIANLDAITTAVRIGFKLARKEIFFI